MRTAKVAMLVLAAGLGFELPVEAQGEAGWALRFHGNGVNDIDRVKISIDAPPRPADVGVGDFTLEFWMYASLSENGSPPCTTGGDSWILGNIVFDRDVYGPGDWGDWGISLYGGRISFGVAEGSNGNSICGATMVANNQWHHVAVTRRVSDGQLQVFVDGNIDAIGTGPTGDVSYRDGRSTPFPNDPFLVIGAEKHDAGPSYPSYSGWIDEVRISTVVRYTGPFTPPSAPFVTDAATAALYHFDEGMGDVVGDTSGAPGGPSNGVRMFGGNPPGPEWVVSTAPLPVDLLTFTVN
jgi:concanavalin A-like lectin/glucanase superfamily protein